MPSAYSPEQISAFLDYIDIPEHHRQNGGPKVDLEFLTDLHVHTLSAIPYENISLHYNEEHTNTLDPQKLFEKIVIARFEKKYIHVHWESGRYNICDVHTQANKEMKFEARKERRN